MLYRSLISLIRAFFFMAAFSVILQSLATAEELSDVPGHMTPQQRRERRKARQRGNCPYPDGRHVAGEDILQALSFIDRNDEHRARYQSQALATFALMKECGNYVSKDFKQFYQDWDPTSGRSSTIVGITFDDCQKAREATGEEKTKLNNSEMTNALMTWQNLEVGESSPKRRRPASP
jgi:hypothetical protein